MTITKGMKQAYDMQDFAYEAAMALKSTLTLKEGALRPPDKDEASMIGTLNKAWKDAQEQVRIHRGKPLPGSLTHEKQRAPRAPRGLSGLASLPVHARAAEQPTQPAPADQPSSPDPATT